MHTEKNGRTMQALCSACWHTLFCLKCNCVSLARGHNASPEARLGAAPKVGLQQQVRFSVGSLVTAVACRSLEASACIRNTDTRQAAAGTQVCQAKPKLKGVRNMH